MANGRVITGFSKPYVALYDANDGNPRYTGVIPLARGVQVSLAIATSGNTQLYVDNVSGENVGGKFTNGTVTLTVDGLKDDACELIQGIKTKSEVTVGSEKVNVYDYDDAQKVPYVGIGFIVRYMEDGVTTYVPVVFPKASFSVDGLKAQSQGENISFQTQELTATLMRDDSAMHKWRRMADAQTTEELAEAVIKAILGGTQ